VIAWLVVFFLALLLIGFDVGFGMVVAAYGGLLAQPDSFLDGTILPLNMVGGVDHYVLVSIPMFILAGELMNGGGLTLRLVDWSQAMVGNVRGSLSQVAILTNVVMAGVSGSGAADAAATGRVLIPAMRARGYGDGYAGAVVAAGAVLGPIIPPSVPMIVYAAMANQSVLKLFLGGVVPGLLLALGYMAICALQARRRGFERAPASGLHDRLSATGKALPVLLLPVIILGGIRFGLTTDTEAASIAALYALLIGVLYYRSLPGRRLWDSFLEAGRSSTIILFLLAAAGPFGWLISESQVNLVIARGVLSISSDPLVGLLVVNLLLLVVGCFLEPLPAMIIFLPALIPIGADLGLDPIHFGVVVIVNLMIGMLTPPVGLLLFVVSAVGDVHIGRVIREIGPFLLWSLAVLVLLTAWPGLVLWLPSTVGP